MSLDIGAGRKLSKTNRIVSKALRSQFKEAPLDLVSFDKNCNGFKSIKCV